MTSGNKKSRAFSFSALKKKYQKSNPTEPIDPPSLQAQDQKYYISREGSPGVMIGPLYLVSYGGEFKNTNSFLENLFNQETGGSATTHCHSDPAEGSSSSQLNEALVTHSIGSNPSLPNVVIQLSLQPQAPGKFFEIKTPSLDTLNSLLSTQGSKQASSSTSPENSPDRNGRRHKGVEFGSDQVPLNQDNSNSGSSSQNSQHCSPGLSTPNDRCNYSSINLTAQYCIKIFPNQVDPCNNTPLAQERVRMSDHSSYRRPKIVQNTPSGTSPLPQAHQATLVESFPFSETAGTTPPNLDPLSETTEDTSNNTLQSPPITEGAFNNPFQLSQSTDTTPFDPSNSPKATGIESLELYKIPEDTQNTPPLLSQATEDTPSGPFDLPGNTEVEPLELHKIPKDIQNAPPLLSQTTEATPSGPFDLPEIPEAIPFSHNQTESLPLPDLAQNSALDPSSINDENQASKSSASPDISSPKISPICSTVESVFERSTINSSTFSYPEPKPSNKRFGKIISMVSAANPALFVGREKLHWTEKVIVKTQAVLNKKFHKSFKHYTATKIKGKLSKLSAKRRHKGEYSRLKSEVNEDTDFVERDCVNEAANVEVVECAEGNVYVNEAANIEEVECAEENVCVNKTDHIGEIGGENVNETTHPKKTKGNQAENPAGSNQTYCLYGRGRSERVSWSNATGSDFETDNINGSKHVESVNDPIERRGEDGDISIELVATTLTQNSKTKNSNNETESAGNAPNQPKAKTESAGNAPNQPKAETEISKAANQSFYSRQNQSNPVFDSQCGSKKQVQFFDNPTIVEYTPYNDDEPAGPDEYTDPLIPTPIQPQTGRAPVRSETRRQVIDPLKKTAFLFPDSFEGDYNSEMKRPISHIRPEPARTSSHKEETTEILSGQDSFGTSSANSAEIKLQESSHEPGLNNTQQCNGLQAVDDNVSANGQIPKDAFRTHCKTTIDGNVITDDINALGTGIESCAKPHTADEHVSENSQTSKDIPGRHHKTISSQNIVQSNTPVYNVDLKFNKRSLPITEHTKKRNNCILPTRPSHSKWYAKKPRHFNHPRTSRWKPNADNPVYDKIPKKECVGDILNLGHENTKRVGYIKAKSLQKVCSAAGNTADKDITESGSDEEVGKEAIIEHDDSVEVENNGEFSKGIGEFVQDIEQDQDYQDTDSCKSLRSYYTAQEYEGDEIVTRILQEIKTIEATKTPKNTKNLNTETIDHVLYFWLLNNQDGKTGRTGRKSRVQRHLNLLQIELYLIHRSDVGDWKWFAQKISDMQRILERIQKVCEAQA